MNNLLKTILCCLILIACQDQENIVLIHESLPNSKAEYQKTIVGQLSGKQTFGNNTLIKSRWSKDEREITQRYLKELIATLSIEAKEHHYRAPNLNPAIDLILDPFSGTNVYGILPATNGSSEYVVLGGHYDSGKRNAPGAIDNATGIALIYSVVKELSKVQTRNKNILIVFFDQEEEELIGSSAFAKFLKQKEWNIHSIHCFDMVGWDADNDKAMEVFSGTDSLLDLYQAEAEELGIPLKIIHIDPVGYDNSSTDFDAFVPLGFNVIGAGECFYHRDSTPYKDSPDDTFDTVNFEYLLSCTHLIENSIKTIVTE
ncbi:M28 family peptidase [Altibacter sp.]|uniref:M28 family metallopeptidase n=1 Tax=Altibacter sp. TaxID=2024823 RepID=UPI000C932560|nr:M28 family peptidase [Altibacter sp.]MAP54510.1 Zn-dependent exopeptidase M28 [Altibacter sp.]